MNEAMIPDMDQEAFRRVWRKVMPQEDRADCPFTLDAPEAPPVQTVQPPVPAPLPAQPAAAPAPEPARSPVCLGDESAGEVPALLRFLALTLSLEKAYRTLARSGRQPLPARLAREKAGQARRLATACFLITGRQPEKPETIEPERLPFRLALRACYRAEQRTAAEFIGTVRESRDPCLAELYRELGGQNQTFAGQIREFLERV